MITHVQGPVVPGSLVVVHTDRGMSAHVLHEMGKQLRQKISEAAGHDKFAILVCLDTDVEVTTSKLDLVAAAALEWHAARGAVEQALGTVLDAEARESDDVLARFPWSSQHPVGGLYIDESHRPLKEAMTTSSDALDALIAACAAATAPPGFPVVITDAVPPDVVAIVNET